MIPIDKPDRAALIKQVSDMISDWEASGERISPFAEKLVDFLVTEIFNNLGSQVKDLS